MPTTEVKQLSDRLPTSFIGKLADWIAANNTLTVFTWFGTALTFTWLVVFARRRMQTSPARRRIMHPSSAPAGQAVLTD